MIKRLAIVTVAITMMVGAPAYGNVQSQSENVTLPITSVQSNKGDLYYTGLRQTLDSIPLYPMETTGSESLDNLLDSIFSRIITDDMDTYDKMVACYDYIIQNTQYGSLVCIGDSYWSAYGQLILGEGVCDTYAATFAVMAHKIGVPLYIVGGETHKADGGFTPHAWCQLDYNGVTYIFDSQVEDSIADTTGYTMYVRFGGTTAQLADKYNYAMIVDKLTEGTKIKNEDYEMAKGFWKEDGIYHLNYDF